jgi:tetratricopeptide (TPR) repeat protein
MRARVGAALGLAAAAALGFAPRPAAAFRDVALGAPLRDRDMPTLDGGRAPLLGSARASVFVFFRPAQDHSLETLRQLARLEREFAGKPVRFVAIASERHGADSVRAMVREAGIGMPVLVDVGDALYGELGVSLHPVVGVADASHRLAAYEHFRKINQLDVLRGRIQLLLGEIGEAEMQRLVAPERATSGDAHAVAVRRLHLGRALLERGHAAQAEESARKSLEADPALAAAHALLGDALAAQQRCDEARAAFGEALRLDPRAAGAREGLARCGR